VSQGNVGEYYTAWKVNDTQCRLMLFPIFLRHELLSAGQIADV